MRIAHLIESDGPGGAERVVVQLATELQRAGAANVVFVPAGGEGWLAGQLSGSAVTVDYFRLDRPFSPAFAQSLADMFRRHRITLAHSHEFSMAVYGAWASWLAGVPHVITMHGGRYYARRLRRRLALRAAIAFSERTVAVSTPLLRAISHDLSIRESRLHMIPNGVQYATPATVTLRDELRLAPGDKLLVSVGNLYPVKGHRHLVDAVARLANRHSNLHLAIAGRGELAEALVSRARDLGIAGRIHLLGLRSDVTAILAAADIFVLPSLSEGLPLALLEAMFAARPIVASDVGEVSVALGHGDAGILVEAGNADALATAIDSLLGDPVRAAALAARAVHRAAAEYDVSRMVQRYRMTYEALLSGRVSPAAKPRQVAI